MVFSHIYVEARWVVDCGVVLDDADNFSTVFLEELGSPVSDSAEALNNDGLAGNAFALFFEEGVVYKAVHTEQLLDAVVNTKASAFGTTFDTTLRCELACSAAFSIDVGFSVHAHVGIFDPSHDLLVCAEIRTKTVDLWPDETLLGELHSVSSGYLLDLALGVLLGINLDTSFSTAEGNVGDGEFESHEGCKCHNFLKINSGVVSCATLDRKLVMLVLGTVASDVFDLTIVTADGDRESNDVVACADQFEIIFGDASLGGGTVEEKFDLLEETRLFGFVLHGREGSNAYR